MMHVPTSDSPITDIFADFASIGFKNATCVDPDGLLHVESDVPQELGEEKQNHQLYT